MNNVYYDDCTMCQSEWRIMVRLTFYIIRHAHEETTDLFTKIPGGATMHLIILSGVNCEIRFFRAWSFPCVFAPPDGTINNRYVRASLHDNIGFKTRIPQRDRFAWEILPAIRNACRMHKDCIRRAYNRWNCS